MSEITIYVAYEENGEILVAQIQGRQAGKTIMFEKRQPVINWNKRIPMDDPRIGYNRHQALNNYAAIQTQLAHDAGKKVFYYSEVRRKANQIRNKALSMLREEERAQSAQESDE